MRFDKGGDVFYEQISALHKSIRGSAPDAALYWFCRMLDGGADPRYIGRFTLSQRRCGNADPRAVEITLALCKVLNVWVTRGTGGPSGLYLASVPKSDAVYRAFSAARDYVANQP